MSLGQAGTAFHKKDGTLLWQSPAGHPGYSSPVPFLSGAKQALAFFSGHAVIGVEADTGKRLWEIPWQTEWDFNAADPVIRDGKLFVSSGNNAFRFDPNARSVSASGLATVIATPSGGTPETATITFSLPEHKETPLSTARPKASADSSPSANGN